MNFGCHFASILDAPDTVKHFALFLCSPKLQKSYPNGGKILSELMTCARCIPEATFFIFCPGSNKKITILNHPGGRPTNQIFRLFFCPGDLWELKWPQSRPEEPPEPTLNEFRQISSRFGNTFWLSKSNRLLLIAFICWLRALIGLLLLSIGLLMGVTG